jgi:hypothetical protein
MHNSNLSSSNGSTEDLFRDSIDSCDNDITEKVGPGCEGRDSLCACSWGSGGVFQDTLQGLLGDLVPAQELGDEAQSCVSRPLPQA